MVSLLFGWVVVSTLAVVLLGLGANAMYGDDYIIANCFYFAAILLLAVKFWRWEETGKLNAHARRVAVLLTIIFAVFIYAGLLKWTSVVARRHRATLVEAPAPAIITKRRSAPIIETKTRVVATTTTTATESSPFRQSPITQALRPIVRDGISLTYMPFYGGPGEPIPRYAYDLHGSTENPESQRYSELGNIAIQALMIDWSSPQKEALFKAARESHLSTFALLNQNKPRTPATVRIFLAGVLQYYVILKIESLQNGQPANLWETQRLRSPWLGTHPPDSVRLSRDALLKMISKNPLAHCDTCDIINRLPETNWVPAATKISLLNKILADGRASYTITFANPRLFRLDVTVEESGANPPMIGQLVPYLTTPDLAQGLITTYISEVKYHFEFYRKSDTDVTQQEDYTRWAELLVAGLKDDLTN